MSENKKEKTRWLKKRYVPLTLLVAFVLWGLWPMLVPRWEQDQCSFGDVTNERYWQMRDEVKLDVKDALSEIGETLKKNKDELKTTYPIDVKLLKRWKPFRTSDEITKFYPRYGDIQKVILTTLISKYSKKSESNNEKLAHMHAIMREMGGWFYKISWKESKKESTEYFDYKYVFSSNTFNNALPSWVPNLIFRYTFVTSKFQKRERAEYRYSFMLRTNLIDGFYYATAFPSGGCPNLISSQKGGV